LESASYTSAQKPKVLWNRVSKRVKIL